MILMDTHVLVWLLDGDPRLHPNAVDAMQFSLQQQRLFVSAATYGELALLEVSGAIDFGVGLDIWRARRMESGIKEIPVNGEMFMLSERLVEMGAPPDPYDRRIMAAAIVRGMQLATADQAILNWDGQLDRLDITARR